MCTTPFEYLILKNGKLILAHIFPLTQYDMGQNI